jgi:alcohol dehydrogenase class IV
MEEVVQNIQEAVEKKSDRAMNHMAHASLTAGMAIAHAGTIVLHALGYPLTVFHNIPHGRANAVMLPVFIEFMKTRSDFGEKARGLDRLWDPHGGIANLLRTLGISNRLSDYGVRGDEIETFVKRTISKKNLAITPARIDEHTLRSLYTEAM